MSVHRNVSEIDFHCLNCHIVMEKDRYRIQHTLEVRVCAVQIRFTGGGGRSGSLVPS